MDAVDGHCRGGVKKCGLEVDNEKMVLVMWIRMLGRVDMKLEMKKGCWEWMSEMFTAMCGDEVSAEKKIMLRRM